jgi:PKD repeat protein
MLWEFGDSGQSDEAAPVYRFLVPGSYRTHLTVEDESGLQAFHDTVIVIGSVSSPPTARILSTPLEGNAPLTVELEGVAQDRFGSVDRFLWTLSDGSKQQGAHVSLTFDEPGYFPVLLEVVDNEGLSGFDQVTVRVLENGLRLPRIVSQPSVTAQAGVAYHYDGDDRAAAQGTKPAVWSVGRTVDGQLRNAPTGLRVDPLSGKIMWVPSEDQVGEQRASLVVANTAGIAAQDFIITVSAETASKASTRKSGCGALAPTPWYGWGVVGILLCRRRGLLRRRGIKS